MAPGREGVGELGPNGVSSPLGLSHFRRGGMAGGPEHTLFTEQGGWATAKPLLQEAHLLHPHCLNVQQPTG